MARRLKTIARWVNQNLGQYGYRATVNSKDYNYSVGNYYGGNVVGYHGSRTGTLFTCWELTDLEDINDEPNAYRRRNLKTFRNVGGVWRKIKSHNSAEPYRYNTQVENFVRRLVAKVRQENPDAEVADYEAEAFDAEVKPKFRNRRGLEMVKDGKVYYSFGRNEKGTKSSALEGFKEELPNFEFITEKIKTDTGGKVEFVFGRKKDAESFESEMKGSVEYERGRTSTQYNLQEISQDYVVELDDEGIVLSEYNLQELEEAKEEIKERIKEEIEENPQEYKDGGDIDDIYSNTEVEFKDGIVRDIGISEGRVEPPKIITSFDNYDSKIEYEKPDDYYAEGFDAESKKMCMVCNEKPVDYSHPNTLGALCSTPKCLHYVFDAESPFKSDAFNEGRSAGITFYTPESTKEDYYANLDTEYMIHYGLSPEDLLNDVENKSPRYLQFIAGFDDGWNYSTLLHEDVIVETTDDDMEEIDYEMAGEYFTDYPKGMRDYIPETPKEFALDTLMVLGVVAAIAGFGAFRMQTKNAEVKLAEESCSGDDDCPEGKVCVDGRCLPICEDDGDCASWQECRDDLHPTEKVCGEQSTDSFQELTTPKPKPQPEVQQDPPKAKESMFNPVSIAIGGGIVAVAVIGMNYLGKKKEE